MMIGALIFSEQAISAGLLARLGDIALAFSDITQNFPECITPKGDYTQSCTGIVTQFYQSPDENVPPLCQLTSYCTTMFSGLPPKDAGFYYPAGVSLEGVSNNNGTLMLSDQPLSRSELPSVNDAKSKAHCSAPQGSYRETCEVKTRPYTSSDKNLVNALLCVAESVCETLGNVLSSTLVYYDLHKRDSTTQKLENCDGALVQSENYDDRRCYKKSEEYIKKLAQKEGSNRLRIT